MNLHEYQAREIFIRYGIPAPEGDIADTVEQAKDIFNRIGKPVAIKAQVLVGGRGKAGGVRIAKDIAEVEKFSSEILGKEIKGYIVNRVLVVEAIKYSKEIYLGITIDRSKKKIVIIASPCGGIDIEEVAKANPDKIFKTYINPLIGLKDYEAKSLADKIQPVPPSFIFNVYNLFIENDCILAEINPLVLSSDDKPSPFYSEDWLSSQKGLGKLLACDTKIIVDDNALFRRPEIVNLRDLKAEDPLEIEAHKYGLSYIGLNGDVACIVNGAGLAMATMDGIQLEGSNPANFLDVGGSSSPQKTLKALEIINRNKNVKSILINIFGGITRCDDIATGIIQAMKSLEIRAPIVVRLTGTNQDKAREMLAGTSLVFAPTMDEAIKKVVEKKGRGTFSL